MNCRRAQLLLYGGPDDDLAAATRDALRAHLASCASCRREQGQIARSDQALVSWVARAPLPSAAAARARLGDPRARWAAQLRRAAAAAGRAGLRLALRGATLLALIALLLGLGSALGLSQARTLVHLGLRPLDIGEPALPVLPVVGDRVWVERASPASEAALGPRPVFELQLGYTLVSAPEALISLRLAPRGDGPSRYFAPPVRVSAGTNRAVVRLAVDEARARELLALGEVQVELLMRAAPGDAPLARATYGRWLLPGAAAPAP